MARSAFVITPQLSSTLRPFPSAFTPLRTCRIPQRAAATWRARIPMRMTAEEEEDENEMQGPSQAPTQKGVSTAGLGEREAKFIEACYDADVQLIESMLTEGVDIDCTDVNRRNALHFCAGNGLPTLCQKLVDAGGNVDLQDIMGFTPLHMATGYKKVDTVRLLLELGADPNIQSFQGQLPVEVAETMLEKVPQKRFFMDNPDHKNLTEIVQVLDAATELEDDDEEEDDGDAKTLDGRGEITEETESAKFVVRVKPKGEEQTPPPTPPSATDVKVTIRVKEPESK